MVLELGCPKFLAPEFSYAFTCSDPYLMDEELSMSTRKEFILNFKLYIKFESIQFIYM